MTIINFELVLSEIFLVYFMYNDIYSMLQQIYLSSLITIVQYNVL